MISGIGVDTVSIQRIESKMESEHFVSRVFSEEERAQLLLLGEKHRSESAAANFGAKEAFLKATQAGLGGFALTEIALLRKQSGAPFLCFSGKAQEYMRANGLTAHVSVTHESGLATVFLVLEKQEV